MFYSAMGRLKAAEAAEPGPQRGALAREAVPLLLRVASSCNLEYVCSRLAHLQQWEGARRGAARLDRLACLRAWLLLACLLALLWAGGCGLGT